MLTRLDQIRLTGVRQWRFLALPHPIYSVGIASTTMVFGLTKETGRKRPGKSRIILGSRRLFSTSPKMTKRKRRPDPQQTSRRSPHGATGSLEMRGVGLSRARIRSSSSSIHVETQNWESYRELPTPSTPSYPDGSQPPPFSHLPRRLLAGILDQSTDLSSLPCLLHLLQTRW